MSWSASADRDYAGSRLQPIKVIIIEDRREMREGLAPLIQFTEGCSCVGRFYSTEEALQQIGESPPDVVLLDIGLPGMSGIEGIEILKECYRQLLILLLTVMMMTSASFARCAPELVVLC